MTIDCPAEGHQPQHQGLRLPQLRQRAALVHLCVREDPGPCIFRLVPDLQWIRHLQRAPVRRFLESAALLPQPPLQLDLQQPLPQCLQLLLLVCLPTHVLMCEFLGFCILLNIRVVGLLFLTHLMSACSRCGHGCACWVEAWCCRRAMHTDLWWSLSHPFSQSPLLYWHRAFDRPGCTPHRATGLHRLLH